MIYPFKYIFSMTVMLLFITVATGQALTITPVLPRRGDTITVRYRAGTLQDTAQTVQMVFTYSNMYGWPVKPVMKRQGDSWVSRLVIPPYGVYATFYLQAGTKQIQPSENAQYEIMAYMHDSMPVEKAMLYKSYSMGAQMHDRSRIHEVQRSLLEKELLLYPGNYEARLRLIMNTMNDAGGPEKASLLQEGNAIIAAKYYKTMPSMDALNQVTMGYLILGENGRLDSIREVTIRKYPNSAVAKELMLPSIIRQPDTTAIVQRLLEEVSKETPGNSEGMRDYHEWLFRYYAARQNGDAALLHAHKMVAGLSGPYYPVQLKEIASTLADNRLEPDSAMVYARRSLALLDSFPIGLIHYFPESGYIRPFVEDSIKNKELAKQKAVLLAVTGRLELERGNKDKAELLAKEALATDSNNEVFGQTAVIYSGTGHPGTAYEHYRRMLMDDPLDTTVIPLLKKAYIQWKGNNAGLADSLLYIARQRKQARMAQLETEALHRQAPALDGITDLDGNPVNPDSLKGKILVMDFWATWCVPCMHEMPFLQKVYDRYKTNKNVQFMIVNSGANNKLEDARKWQEKVDYTFPVFMHTHPNVGERFGFNVIPALFVIDHNGMLQYKTTGFEGPSVEETLSLELELLLSKMH